MKDGYLRYKTVISDSRDPQRDRNVITASTGDDPNGYNSCYTKANDDAAKCLLDAGNDETEQLACGCVLYLDEVDCVAESCWNQVCAFPGEHVKALDAFLNQIKKEEGDKAEM